MIIRVPNYMARVVDEQWASETLPVISFQGPGKDILVLGQYQFQGRMFYVFGDGLRWLPPAPVGCFPKYSYCFPHIVVNSHKWEFGVGYFDPVSIGSQAINRTKQIKRKIQNDNQEKWLEIIGLEGLKNHADNTIPSSICVRPAVPDSP